MCQSLVLIGGEKKLLSLIYLAKISCSIHQTSLSFGQPNFHVIPNINLTAIYAVVLIVLHFILLRKEIFQFKKSNHQ